MGFKSFLSLGLMLSMATSIFARAENVEVDGKRLVAIDKVYFNEKSNSLDIKISYVGGCEEHSFDYEKEIIGSKVIVSVFETNFFRDTCKGNVRMNLGIPLEQISLDLSSYIIEVHGAQNSKYTAFISSVIRK